MIETYLNTHKGTKRDNGKRGSPNNALPGSSQEPSARRSPTFTAQSTAKWQVRTQITGWARDRQSGLSQSCPRRVSAQGSRPKTHHHKSVPEHFLDWKGVAAEVYSTHDGMQGKSILGLHRNPKGLFKERTKGSKEGHSGNLRKKQYGQRKG